MRAEQPSMVTDGGDHASHVAEIEKVDFLQIYIYVHLLPAGRA